MGRFLGKHIPDNYDHWWQEREDMPEHEQWWHLGHEDGYQDGYDAGFGDIKKQKNLEGQIDSLKELLAANVRVIRADLEKEYGKPTRIPEQELQTLGNPSTDG